MSAAGVTTTVTPCQYPPPVEAGDTVAVLAPSHAAPAVFDRGLDRLRSFDLNVEVYPTARRSTSWLKDHPDERAADLRRAFAADDVRGIVAAMGGNVAYQLFSRLDLDVVRHNPTRLFGGSDNTHLHALLTRCGLVSFYGGQLFPDLVADAEVHPYTRRQVRRALRATPFGELRPAEEWTDSYADFEPGETRSWFPSEGWIWHGPDEGTVRGPVVGGCLSMLRTQLALEAASVPIRGPEGCVLVVETSGESPPAAAVERFFGALGERGALDAAAALLVGKPETPGGSLAEREQYRTEQRRTIRETVGRYADLPIIFDLDVGHAAPVLPLPLGGPVEIDFGAEAIRCPAPGQ